MYATLCLLLATLWAQAPVTLAGSIKLDGNSFAKEVDATDKPYFVMFGGPVETTESSVDPFEQLADKISSSGISVGRVDCTGKVRKNKMICASIINFGANSPESAGLPQMAMYAGRPEPNPYTKKPFRKPTLLPMVSPDGQPAQVSEKDVERFIVKSLPHSIRRVTFVAQLLNGTADAVYPSDPQPASDGNTLPVAVLVGAKEAVPLAHKVVSHRLADMMQLYQVHVEKSEQVLSAIVPQAAGEGEEGGSKPKVKVPSMGVLVSSISAEALAAGVKRGDAAAMQGVVWYDGDMKDAAAMVDFLSLYAAPVPTPTATEEEAAKEGASDAAGASKEAEAKGKGKDSKGKGKGKGKGKSQKHEGMEDPNGTVLTADELVGVQSLSPQYAWIVAVAEEAAAEELPGWDNRIARFGEGAVRLAEVRCGGEVGEGAQRNDTLGHVLCRRSSLRPPYVQVFPYEYGTVDPDSVGSYATDRRKMVLPAKPTAANVAAVSMTLAKSAFSLPVDGDDVTSTSSSGVYKEIRRAAWESLPEDAVDLVSEYDMQGYIQDGYIRRGGALTVLILAQSGSEGSDGSSSASSLVPTTYRNVALSLGQYYSTQVGIIHDPSYDYLASLNHPQLPAVLVLYPSSPEEGDSEADVAQSAAEAASQGSSGGLSGVKRSKNQKAAKADADAKRKLAEDDSGAVKFQIALYSSQQFGAVRYMSIMQFALTVFSQAGIQPLPSAAAGGAGGGSSPPPSLKELASQEQWEAECGEDSGFRGLCAVALLSRDSGDGVEGEGSSEAWKTHSDAMLSVVRALQRDPSSSTAYAAFKFVALDGRCQHAFVESLFGVTAVYMSLPTVLVYSPSKKRYAIYQPQGAARGIEEEGVRSFLLSVISGKVSTIPLPPSSGAVLVPADECASVYSSLGLLSTGVGTDGSAEVLLGEDADVPMDDFMAEIRREEEEARKARAAEVEAEALLLAEEAKAKEAEAKAAAAASAAPRKVKRVVKKKKKSSA